MSHYSINETLLAQSHTVLSGRRGLFWILGGAGSGKTTLCRHLSKRFDIPIYDMDAQIYGAYHSRFTQERHPINYRWSSAQNGLAWLLQMSWDEFDAFHRAALPEYLDLLAEDLRAQDFDAGLLIDGGIWHPALLAKAIPTPQIVCLAAPWLSSAQIWEANAERRAMQEFVHQLPEPEKAWHTFLEFDCRITGTLLRECRENDIAIHVRTANESVDESCATVARILGILRGIH